MRFCYIAKLNEHELKSDPERLERDLEKLLHQEEEVPAEHPEIDFREGNMDGVYTP